MSAEPSPTRADDKLAWWRLEGQPCYSEKWKSATECRHIPIGGWRKIGSQRDCTATANEEGRCHWGLDTFGALWPGRDGRGGSHDRWSCAWSSMQGECKHQLSSWHWAPDQRPRPNWWQPEKAPILCSVRTNSGCCRSKHPSGLSAVDATCDSRERLRPKTRVLHDVRRVTKIPCRPVRSASVSARCDGAAGALCSTLRWPPRRS